MSEHLLSAFLDELAERVAARLSGGEPHAQIQRSPDPWRLWTLEETAQRLTRSERWVRERAKQGELPFVRLDGGALAFDPADVRAFADGRRVGPELPANGAVRQEWWK